MIGIGKGYNILKIPPFCQLNKEYQWRENSKCYNSHQLFSWDAEMCICFHLNFQLLKFFIRNSKKQLNLKLIFPVPYPIGDVSHFFIFYKFFNHHSFYEKNWIRTFRRKMNIKIQKVLTLQNENFHSIQTSLIGYK